MSSLSQLIESPKRSAVASDLAAFVEDAVSQQSGITGMAIKGAVAAAKKIDSGIVPKGMNRMLPDIVEGVEPLWQEFTASGQEDFGAFLQPRSAEVTDIIMGVADRNADSISVPTLAKAYSSLRGKASKIVEPQVPALARILQKHM